MPDERVENAMNDTTPVAATLVIETPLGPFIVIADDTAIVRVTRAPEAPHSDTVPSTPDAAHPAALQLCQQAAQELAAYFAGTLQRFTVPVRPAGSSFQQQVWEQLVAIDFGKTKTYGDVARRLSDLGASRAVGVACGANPVPLIIPCHRVVAAAGGLGGFGLGLPAKEWLLAHEGARGQQLGLFG